MLKHATKTSVRLLSKPRLHSLPSAIREALSHVRPNALVTLVLLARLSYGPASAATIHVNATCTLVDAITAANKDRATGGCTAGYQADIIMLPPNSIQMLIAVNNDINGLPPITTQITIAGYGSTIKRHSTAPNFRILEVASSGNLTLNATKISNGSSEGSGGGIKNAGTLTLNNSTISGNLATDDGGGIFSTIGRPHGYLIINNSTISDNHATSKGGGIFATESFVTVNRSTVSSNSAESGGGLAMTRAVVTVNSSAVTDNTADSDGGGILTNSGFSVINSTVSGNSAGLSGGGILFSSFYYVTPTVTNNTISGNRAGLNGGGLFIWNWSARSLRLHHNLISGNNATYGQEIFLSGIDSLSNESHNLFGYNGNAGIVGYPLDATDIVPTQALEAILKPLAFNGGPTSTHLLVKGSPAINAGPNDANCGPEQDQRGLIRPRGGACDIGAVEVTDCEIATPTHGCTVNGVAGQPCRGTAGADTIQGTSGDDVILGLNGNDTLQGFGGNDQLCGGVGKDILEGGSGSDKLFGGFGGDILRGGGNDDRLFGEQDDDTLNGGSGADKLDGGPGAKDKCTTDADDSPPVGCEL